MYTHYEEAWDAYEKRSISSNSIAYSKAYLTETTEEAIARKRKEYEEMLLAKNFKASNAKSLKDYDRMLMGRR
jgi:hypothetical protein